MALKGMSLTGIALKRFDFSAWRTKWPALRQAARNDELFVILLAVVAGAVSAVGSLPCASWWSCSTTISMAYRR
jgi:hypothetical protein